MYVKISAYNSSQIPVSENNNIIESIIWQYIHFIIWKTIISAMNVVLGLETIISNKGPNCFYNCQYMI